jgi:hypothetical protein
VTAMQRPRARAGRATVAGVTLALLLAGCGSNEKKVVRDEGPSKETLACRGEWKDLGQEVEGRDEQTNPSALAPRWNSVVATIGYYETSATEKDCDDAIDRQQESINKLTSFAAKLAPYDVELKLDRVRDDAEAYAAGPRPPRPKPSPVPKGKKQNAKKPKRPPLPPKPADIAAALKTLVAQAPVATRQQGPGWQQARVVELSDAAAVRKAVKDLAFLSTESRAYRKCSAALAEIRTALAARE